MRRWSPTCSAMPTPPRSPRQTKWCRAACGAAWRRHRCGRRFGVTPDAADGSTPAHIRDILQRVDAAFCAGRAGVRILDAAMLAAAPTLRLVADVNAVPPLGVEGQDVAADGAALPNGTLGSGTLGSGALGIGALAIGPTKSRTEAGLFRRMIAAEQPVTLDFRDAFALARDLVRG